MVELGKSGELLQCSFCGKSQLQVKKLIAGRSPSASRPVYICDECVALCAEIITVELGEAP